MYRYDGGRAIRHPTLAYLLKNWAIANDPTKILQERTEMYQKMASGRTPNGAVGAHPQPPIAKGARLVLPAV